jgi:hypothetical protein
MKVVDNLLTKLPNGTVQDVRLGAFWTAVVVEVAAQRRCGLASTLWKDDHHHRGRLAVQAAGRLLDHSARELAELAHSDSSMEAGIGIAAINALLPRHEELWTDLNAEEVIIQHGAGKSVALVGHFPFIPRLRAQVGTLWVLEQEPWGEELPAGFADYVIPHADVIALAGTTLINHTFEELMALRRPEALILVLGLGTPLSPLLFEHGVHLLSGVVVEDVTAVLQAVSQGADFDQLHQQGIRPVTMQKV